MGIVLIHGGSHGAWGWSRVIPHLLFDTLAVDLPGPDGDPTRLPLITYDDRVGSAVDQIARLSSSRFVLAGHSLAGIVFTFSSSSNTTTACPEARSVPAAVLASSVSLTRSCDPTTSRVSSRAAQINASPTCVIDAKRHVKDSTCKRASRRGSSLPMYAMTNIP